MTTPLPPAGSGSSTRPIFLPQEVVCSPCSPSQYRAKGLDTHALLQGVAEGLLQGRHTAGHVWRVRKLGRPMHEVIHRRPSWVPVGEVEVPMALVVVACRKDVEVTGEGLSWGKVELLSDGS